MTLAQGGGLAQVAYPEFGELAPRVEGRARVVGPYGSTSDADIGAVRELGSLAEAGQYDARMRSKYMNRRRKPMPLTPTLEERRRAAIARERRHEVARLLLTYERQLGAALGGLCHGCRCSPANWDESPGSRK